MYAEFSKDSPGFTLKEEAVAAWAEELIADGNPVQATDVLELLMKVHPDSSTAYSDLGEAYWLSGKRAAAIDSYRKALDLAPDNDAARRGLEQAGASALTR